MTKRRVKGEGSVYQRKDGRFVGEYDDANGRRRYVSGKNKTDVRTKLREKLAERDRGIVVDAGGLTVGMYLDQWLGSTRDTVSLRTYQRGEIAARVHIKPTLGKVKLDRLTAMQLDSLYRDKLKSGLSARSVQIIHATVHKAMKQAVRWRMVGMNVAEHATPPRSTGREMQPLNRDQTKSLLRTAQRNQPKMYALYAIAATTGARIGEILALQRGDVDLDAGTLRISKSVHEGRVTPPKTSSGRRTIMLSKLALDALREHMDVYAGDVWVFPATSNPDKSFCRSTLRLFYWKPLLKACGLPHETRMHDLRHGAASMLLAEGVPVPVVSALLGHRDPSITLRVYAKMMADQQGTAALVMNGLLAEEGENALA